MRAAFGGVAYNIGNAVSSVAPTIETSLGERFATADGKPDYARTQLILVAIVIVLFATTLALMPLKRLNKEWDHIDPNMVIPSIVTESKTLAEMGDGHADEEYGKTGETTTDTMHIERA